MNFFCEIFKGVYVFQLQGLKSKEYVFGLYRLGEFIGHIYLGKVYSKNELAAICEKYFPLKIDEIMNYSETFSDEVDYYLLKNELFIKKVKDYENEQKRKRSNG